MIFHLKPLSSTQPVGPALRVALDLQWCLAPIADAGKGAIGGFRLSPRASGSGLSFCSGSGRLQLQHPLLDLWPQRCFIGLGIRAEVSSLQLFNVRAQRRTLLR